MQEAGRRHVYAQGGVAALTGLLGASNPRVASRAVGAIHNLSSHAEVIKWVLCAGRWGRAGGGGWRWGEGRAERADGG